MKYFVKIILLTSFYFTTSTFCVYSQSSKATLYFKDGAKLSGLGKLKNNGQIKFRLNKNSKAVKYNFKDLEKVIIDFHEYTRLKTSEDEYVIVEPMIKGYISLYQSRISWLSTTAIDKNNGTTSASKYYIKKTNDEYAYFTGSNISFNTNIKGRLQSFFSDCPQVINKIETGEFKKKDIRRIVNFYNYECH